MNIQEEIEQIQREKKNLTNRLRKLYYKSNKEYRRKAIEASRRYQIEHGNVMVTDEQKKECAKIVEQTKQQLANE